MIQGSLRYVWVVLLALLLADLVYAALQYYQTPLDGDMPPGIMITWDVQKIFDDPLGIRVMASGHGHANPNRFFCHWAFAKYFRTVPLALQTFVDPITSVYLACTIAKVAIHVGSLVLLALFVRSRTGGGSVALIFLVVLTTPLMQIDEYRPAIAIIDQSITYTFFYALPALGFLLLAWCLRSLILDPPRRPLAKVFFHLMVAGLAFTLPLSGPLVAPCAILGVMILTIRSFCDPGLRNLHWLWAHRRSVIALVSLLLISSIYSLWLGTFNVIGTDNQLPLKELYAKLPEGLEKIFIEITAIPIIVAMIVLNMAIIHVMGSKEKKPLLIDMGWASIFIVTYIALLPLGGYRPWREDIIRFDTAIPLTIGLFYFYLATTWIVITQLRSWNWLYGLVLGAFLLHFIVTDLDASFADGCQRRAIEKIALSSGSTVPLQEDCPVLSWNVITDPDHSVLQGELLHFWKIVDEPRKFYHEPVLSSK